MTQKYALRCAAFCAAGLGLFCGDVAWAQGIENRNFDANRLRVTPNRDDILNTYGGGVTEHLDWDAALWLNYANDAVTLKENGERFASLLSHRVDAHFVGAMGLYGWLQVGVDAPISLFQRRSDPNLDGAGLAELSGTGIGDLGLTARAQLLNSKRHGLDLAFVPNLTIPTGVPRDAYFGERTLTFTPEFAGSRRFSDLTVAGNLGARLRRGVADDVGSLDAGHEVIFRAAARYDFEKIAAAPLSADLTWEGFTQLTSPFEASNTRGSELLAALGYLLDAGNRVNVKLFVGGGFGLQPAYSIPDYRAFAGITVHRQPAPQDPDNDGLMENDQCPEKPEDFDEFEDTDGCPDPDNDGDGVLDAEDDCPMDAGDAEHRGCKDSDGDGIPDTTDRCVDEAEDIDGFEDEDGCPELDNDDDGIADTLDSCPNEPGPSVTRGCPDLDSDGDTVVDRLDNCPDVPGWPENNGCKEKQLVAINGCKIDLSKKIYFDTGRTVVKSRSYKMLNNLAQVLAAQKNIKSLRIEGHTDDRGAASFNKQLSQQRADAVRIYLEEQGIGPERLEAIGFGEERPVESNATRRGRENNRRVELTLVAVSDDQFE